MRYEKMITPDNKSLARPKTNTRENETSAKILHAATELFVQRGYKDVTLRDIAAQAGVNLGLISYYYTSKENLGNAVYDRWGEDVFNEIEQIDLAGFSNVEQMYIVCALSGLYLDQHPVYSKYLKFYYEFIDSRAVVLIPTRYVERKSQEIIAQYGLHVPRELNKLYLEIFKVTENHLTLKKARGDSVVTNRLLLNLSFSNYLYNIGLPDNIIADTIVTGSQFVDNFKLPFEC